MCQALARCCHGGKQGVKVRFLRPRGDLPWCQRLSPGANVCFQCLHNSTSAMVFQAPVCAYQARAQVSMRNDAWNEGRSEARV